MVGRVQASVKGACAADSTQHHRHAILRHAVRLEPVTSEWAEALAAGDDAIRERFGIEVAPGWAVVPETIPMLLHALRNGTPPDWRPHLVFDDDGALVGTAGWKGAPVNGVAELGYAVAPSRRGRGIATAAVEVLIRRARRAGVRVVVAHTLPRDSASTTVLRRCAFVHVGEFLDPDEGPMWRWEVALRAAGELVEQRPDT